MVSYQLRRGAEMRRRVVWLLTVMTVVFVMVESPAWATTFTVNSTADTGDASPDGVCDTCTLREAMQEANANDNVPASTGNTIGGTAPAARMRARLPWGRST